MSRVVTTARVDDALLAEVLGPRSGEAPEGTVATDGADTDHHFAATEGPFQQYRRTVVVGDRTAEGTLVTQTVEFQLDIPIFWWLFVLPFRQLLGKLGQSKTPWWAPPDALDARAASMLASLCALSAIAVYPGFLLSQTIPFAREEMGFSHRAESLAFASVRADFVIALVVVALADRRGRRQLTLASVVAACVMAAAGAAAPNLWVLAGTQVLCRGFLTGAAILISIMAAEEMPAGSRAYAISLISIAGALGAAPVLLLLPLADVDKRGWRLLFLLALIGVPLVRRFGRSLPESKRFAAPHATSSRLAGHGGRFWLLAISALLFAIFLAPAAQLQNEFLRSERHFSAARISLFTVATNIWGGIGVVAGGHLADVRGRRTVGAVGVVGGVGATVAMFLAAGWGVWAWSTIGAIVGAVTVPALGVYGPELFPTAMRGRANGIISGLGRVGSVIGLVVVGILADRFGRIGPALAIAAIGPALLVVVILLLYPETAHMELEDLNPEDRPPLPSVADGPV